MSWTYQDLAAYQSRLGAHIEPKPARTNLTNTGKSYEKLFEMTTAAYERKGLLMLRKVDPPVKFIAGRVVFWRIHSSTTLAALPVAACSASTSNR